MNPEIDRLEESLKRMIRARTNDIVRTPNFRTARYERREAKIKIAQARLAELRGEVKQ